MQAGPSLYTRGFSLVELSIVLVIIGLLVGGILAGRSLIRASELRKLGTDITNYRTAAFAFRDKYFQIPGDITNAASFWATAINGNGDRRLGFTLDGINFWNHLQQAGLLSSNIAPLSGAVATPIIGTHVPPCPLGSCGYTMVYFSTWTNQPQLETRNILYIGSAASSGYPSNGITGLRPEDVWNIDTKYDDGKADLGTFLTAGSCSSGTYPDRTYYLNQPDRACYVLVDFFK